MILNACHLDNKKFTESEFFIKNSCDHEIEIFSSAIVQYYEEGPKEEHRHFLIKAGELKFLRKLGVTDSFNITNVFTKLEIYKKHQKSNYPVMDKSKWKKTVNMPNPVTFTLIVDSTFFE